MIAVFLLMLVVLVALNSMGFSGAFTAKVIGAACIFLILFGLSLLLKPYFGENAVNCVMFSFLGLLVLLALWVGLSEAKAPPARSLSMPVPGDLFPASTANASCDSGEALRIWERYAVQLEPRLSLSERTSVDGMIQRGEVQKLEWSCKTWMKQRPPR